MLNVSAIAHLVKLVHVFAGIYVYCHQIFHLRQSESPSAHRWEYTSNLDFEWEIYTGQRHWRWSFVVYLSARILALASLITLLVGFDIKTPYDCNVSMLLCRLPFAFLLIFGLFQ